MKYLLDTHAFIWLDGEPDKLSSVAAAICSNVDNTILFSIASVWEMQIKSQLGKLALRLPLSDLVQSQQENNLIRLLPIELAHILALGKLPNLSRDPFDRLLVAQAITEDAVLVSHDSNIRQYPVKMAWRSICTFCHKLIVKKWTFILPSGTIIEKHFSGNLSNSIRTFVPFAVQNKSCIPNPVSGAPYGESERESRLE